MASTWRHQRDPVSGEHLPPERCSACRIHELENYIGSVTAQLDAIERIQRAWSNGYGEGECLLAIGQVMRGDEDVIRRWPETDRAWVMDNGPYEEES